MKIMTWTHICHTLTLVRDNDTMVVNCKHLIRDN